jgi:hypothetical protein
VRKPRMRVRMTLVSCDLSEPSEKTPVLADVSEAETLKAYVARAVEYRDGVASARACAAAVDGQVGDPDVLALCDEDREIPRIARADHGARPRADEAGARPEHDVVQAVTARGEPDGHVPPAQGAERVCEPGLGGGLDGAIAAARHEVGHGARRPAAEVVDRDDANRVPAAANERRVESERVGGRRVRAARRTVDDERHGNDPRPVPSCLGRQRDGTGGVAGRPGVGDPWPAGGRAGGGRSSDRQTEKDACRPTLDHHCPQLTARPGNRVRGRSYVRTGGSDR